MNGSSKLALFIVGFGMAGWIGNGYGQSNVYAHNRVSIVLSETMGLALNGQSGDRVDLRFFDATAYSAGLSLLMKDHLVITSNRRFNLVARAARESFVGGGADHVPVSVLRIEVADNAVERGRYVKQPIEHLSTIDRPLLLQYPPLNNRFLNVKYTISAIEPSRHILGKQPGAYTNAVIYTLITL